VPIRHEEVSVERVPVEGREGSEAEIGEDEITMPVTEEEVITEKRPVVKGEIRIRKNAVQDEEVVEEDVRREEVDVEDATATRGRRGAAKTAQSAQPEGRAEEDRPGREETGRDEDFFEKAKRKLQGQ
jgi:stress response protein YsnF